jgi:hypothetical protein
MLIAFGAFAQDPPQQPPTTPPSQQEQGGMRGRAMATTGTVKSYDPGKSISVDAKGSTKTYDLSATDQTVTVAPDVKVGSKVKITEKPDSTGRKTIAIEMNGSSN